MEERQKPDFRKHTLPPVSKQYLIRIVVYVLLLIGVAAFILMSKSNQDEKSIDEVNTIQGIQLDTTLN